MGVGQLAGNFLTHTSYSLASSCDKKLPANREKNDVAGNWLLFDQWSEDRNNCTALSFLDCTLPSALPKEGISRREPMLAVQQLSTRIPLPMT